MAERQRSLRRKSNACIAWMAGLGGISRCFSGFTHTATRWLSNSRCATSRLPWKGSTCWRRPRCVTCWRHCTPSRAAMPRFHLEGEALRGALAAAGDNVDLEAVLETVAGGPEVITVVAEARHEVERMQRKALTACGIAQRYFALGPSAESGGFTEFVQNWSRK